MFYRLPYFFAYKFCSKPTSETRTRPTIYNIVICCQKHMTSYNLNLCTYNRNIPRLRVDLYPSEHPTANKARPGCFTVQFHIVSVAMPRMGARNPRLGVNVIFIFWNMDECARSLRPLYYKLFSYINIEFNKFSQAAYFGDLYKINRSAACREMNRPARRIPLRTVTGSL